MSKLPQEYRFVDLSDYGRPAARLIAGTLKNTAVTPIQVTISFIIAGLLGVTAIVYEQYLLAAFFLVLKSVLDAADGELARVKNTPSYAGRYFDSVSDIVLNFIIFFAIASITDTSLLWVVVAFVAMQLQGTLYNYYYVILRQYCSGDMTSRIIEDRPPTALQGEKQRTVNILFWLYFVLYGVFDRIILLLDHGAAKRNGFPPLFMTAVSIFGLGFQLLLIGVMLVLGLKQWIIPFFIIYSLLIFVFVAIRRWVLVQEATIPSKL